MKSKGALFMTEIHIPVFLDDVLNELDIAPNDIIFEGTVGFSGHASEICKQLFSHQLEAGIYLGVDRDSDAFLFSKKKLSQYPHAFLYQTTFDQISTIKQSHQISAFTKLFLDLGVSSYQLDTPERGFSYTYSGPLDMRMSMDEPLSAADILNNYDEEALSRVFDSYSDLHSYQKLIDTILIYRQNQSFLETDQLIDVIKKSFYFRNNRKLFLRTCAQVFQSIRIEVNDELGCLHRFLDHLKDNMAVGGRLAIITFHSIEDRIVKQFAKNQNWLVPVGKKVRQYTYHQAKTNPRARSAKLRVLERIAPLDKG